MSGIYKSIDELIGRTPILELTKFEEKFHLKAKLFAKLEAFNPAGSVKDRAAKFMLDDAERRGLLKKGSVIIEPTSGNTGIGLSSLAASRGYKVIIVMPDNMSAERIKIMKAYGAQVILTDGKLGMKGAIEKAEALSAEIPDAFIPGQFDNPANAQAHYCTTGPEIWEALDGQADIFVSGVGTGGTITGTGRFLKDKRGDIKVVAVEPASSPYLSEGVKGAHAIQGIGAGFVPAVLDTEIYDEIFKVENENALETGRLLGVLEGFLAGISSGAALYAAVQIAQREENAGRNIVVLLPDTGERYLSSVMFS